MDDSGEVKIVGGVKVVEVDPGEPLPPGVPPWAERCDLVETPDLSPALRPWFVGVGAAGTLSSVVALAFFSQWGITPLLPSLVLLYHGLVPGTTTVVIPSQSGRYVGFEVADAEEGGKAFGGRIAALVVGAIMVVAALAQLFSADRGDWVGLASLAGIGAYFVYYGCTGEDARPDAPERPSTLRFRALADPSRPLAELLEPTRSPAQEAALVVGDPVPPPVAAERGSSSPIDPGKNPERR
jgi:hypothetical protein